MQRTVLGGATLDPEAFVLIIARHERRIRGFIATLLPFDRAAVDDLVQTTYLVAWRKLTDFRYQGDTPDEEAVRWIIAIARFETFSYLRASKKRRALEFDEELLGEIADTQADDWDAFDARWRAFTGCVQKLPEQQREVIKLRYGAGLSLDEIGKRHERPANTIAVRLSRIRKTLEECIRASLRNEGYC